MQNSHDATLTMGPKAFVKGKPSQKIRRRARAHLCSRRPGIEARLVHLYLCFWKLNAG